MLGEGAGGARADRGDGGAGQGAGVAARRAASASNSRRTPLGLVRQTSAYSPIAATAGAHLLALDPRLDPDRRQLDHLGAEVAQGRGEAAGLGAGAGDDDAAAVQRAALEPGEVLAAGGDRADDDQRRGADLLALDRGGDRPQGRDDGALAGPGAAFDRGGRLVGVAPGGDQRRRVLGQPFDAHVEDERAGEAGERLPVERRLSAFSGSSWPVTKATAEASSRWVTGMPA